jgi:hypothetical protein
VPHNILWLYSTWNLQETSAYHLHVLAWSRRGSTLKVSTFLCMVSWLTHVEHLQLSLE